MNTRASSLAVVVAILAFPSLTLGAEAHPASVADAAIKDIKYDAAAKSPTPVPRAATGSPPAESEALGLSPYIVRELPDRTYNKLNEAIHQQQRLATKAFYKKDLTPKVRADFLSAPEEGSRGKANFPLFRLSW